MFGLFNPAVIVRAHLATLRDFATGRYSLAALALFFGLPLIGAVFLLSAGVVVTENAADVLITSMSIFTALLLNLQMLVFELANRAAPPSDGSEAEAEWQRLRQRFLREIFSNISFAILVAIGVVVLLLVWVVLPGRGEVAGLAAFSAVVYYGTATFLVTLFMVLQRVHVLFARQVAGGA